MAEHEWHIRLSYRHDGRYYVCTRCGAEDTSPTKGPCIGARDPKEIGTIPGLGSHIEVLRRLQRWIKSVGTDDKTDPPAEHAADAAIDLVLKENYHLREGQRRPCPSCERMFQRIADAQVRVAPHLDEEGKRGQLARAVANLLIHEDVGSG